jgi:hypothetical protein
MEVAITQVPKVPGVSPKKWGALPTEKTIRTDCEQITDQLYIEKYLSNY